MLILYEFSWNILRNRVNKLRHGWTSAQELRHQIWTSAQVINFGTPFFMVPKLTFQSKLVPKLTFGAEVHRLVPKLLTCRSYSCRTSIAPIAAALVPKLEFQNLFWIWKEGLKHVPSPITKLEIVRWNLYFHVFGIVQIDLSRRVQSLTIPKSKL